MTEQAVLREIMRRDPDGGSVQPTEADYTAFERWAITTYGQAAWDAYRVPGWGEDRGPDYFPSEDY